MILYFILINNEYITPLAVITVRIIREWELFYGKVNSFVINNKLSTII